MPTTQEYVEQLCEDMKNAGITGKIKYKPMYEEYVVHVNGKQMFLVFNNTVYVKDLEEIKHMMKQMKKAVPYEGMKPYYIVDTTDKKLLKSVVSVLLYVLPNPKRKTPNQKLKQERARRPALSTLDGE